MFEVLANGEISEHYSNLTEPGLYAVVRYSDADRASVADPIRRLFHVGEISTLEPRDRRNLAAAGIRTNLDVSRAGLTNLRQVLRDETLNKVLTAFGRLGVPIPENGDLPRPSRRQVVELSAEYHAYGTVSRSRKQLATLAAPTQSVFVGHAAGFDVVCGVCGAQQVAVPERQIPSLICPKCGTHIGGDFKPKTHEAARLLTP